MATDAQTLINQVAAQGYEKLSKRELIECLLAAAQVGGGGGTPSYQDMQVAWTPSNLKLGEKIGLFSYIGIAGLTSLTLSQSTWQEGCDIENNPDLLSVDLPNLTTCDVNGFGIEIIGNPVLTLFTAPILTNPGIFNLVGSAVVNLALPSITDCTSGFKVSNNTSLITASFPQLVNINGCIFSGNTALTTTDFSVLIPSSNATYDFTNCALSAASVNQILARCVANAGFIAGLVDLSGGTSDAPTGQGILDKATLNGRLPGLAVTN